MHPASSARPQLRQHRLPAHSTRPPQVGCRRGASAARASAKDADGRRVGVVIVDHGSRKVESNQMLHQFAELYKAATRRTIVEVAHMEIAEPTIEQAVGACARQGAEVVVVAPYFLSNGRHIQQDIPALVKEAQQAHPNVECVVSKPLGLHESIAMVLEERITTELETPAAAVLPRSSS